MTMETIEYVGSGGVTLMADVRGDPDANPILFMQGGGQTRHSWGGAAELLAERGWQTIRSDRRGHGDSGWSEEGDYEAEHFAADINAVLATLGRKSVLVGASLGGRTATFVVGNGVPDLCRALVLVDITPKIETKGVERILAFMNKHPDGFETVEDAADAVAEYREHRSRPKDVSGLKKNLRLRENGRWYWHWDPKFLERRHPHEEAASEAISAAASRISIPTLLVRGGSSGVVSLANVADFMRLVPHAEFVDVAEAGHMVAGDRNDAFAGGVITFLENTFG